MADLGFTELSMEPVVCAPEDPYALTEEDKPILFEQYELLAKEMLKREKRGQTADLLSLYAGFGAWPPASIREFPAVAAARNIWPLTPWGDLYPCHQFVGDGKIQHGRYLEGRYQ